jgi:outer membrane lipoprotein carrier protein
MLRQTSAAVLALSTLLCASPTGRAAAPSEQETARALQKKYAAIKDFSADFVHIYEGGVLRKKITERGHVLIKKPGKMRWEYTAPEQKLFVSDGLKVYSYIPQDKQVFVGTVPSDDHATTPVLFLSGKGDITRDFTAAPPGDLLQYLPPGVGGLKLVPKKRQPDYDWLVVGYQPETFAIVGLVTVDAQGGKSSFSFTNLKENVGLADKAFAFKMPRGVDVVTDAGRR